MKKIILLFIAAGAGFSAMAQVRGGDNFYAQKYVVDLNFPVGVLMQTPTYKFDANYTNVANQSIGTLKMGAGASYGVDAQFGYFIGKRRCFGIGTGISYTMMNADATLGNFHVEYQDKDAKDNIFWQVVSSTQPVKEKLTITSINIPVVLKYKKRFTTKLGFTMDAGILYNIQYDNKWKTDGTFDYEAIYKFAKNSVGSQVTVYDGAAAPDAKDWLITKAMYERTISVGTIPGIFDSLRTRGYDVALGVHPANNSGKISYTTGSIGFIVRPAINIRIKKRVHLNLGAYYSYQSFNNKTVDNYKLIDKMGSSYSSLLNTVSTTVASNMGINVGLRYFIGMPKDKDFDGKFDE